MSINDEILAEVNNCLSYYGCDYSEIDNFLHFPNNFAARQVAAIDIIENAMTDHQKRPLASTIAQVSRIENAVKSIQPHLRDHVIHAVLSFLLGMHLNENWLKPNGYNGVSNFKWKLAGLFHDIGYPLQVVNAIFRDVIEHINTLKNNIGSTGNLGTTLDVNNLESLEKCNILCSSAHFIIYY